jgi:hypothetical protein
MFTEGFGARVLVRDEEWPYWTMGLWWREVMWRIYGSGEEKSGES